MEQSKAGYYADFVLFPLLIVGLGTCDVISVRAFPYMWLCALALGLLTWTIVEYGVHRFVLHSVDALARLHEQHHATPGAYVGTPTWVSLLCFALGGFAPALVLFGWEVANGATIGLLFGYLWYLLVHDAVHRRHLQRGSLLYPAKMHHALHHHAKVAGNFGVTSSFWDRVCGTHITPNIRRAVSFQPRRQQSVSEMDKESPAHVSGGASNRSAARMQSSELYIVQEIIRGNSARARG